MVLHGHLFFYVLREFSDGICYFNYFTDVVGDYMDLVLDGFFEGYNLVAYDDYGSNERCDQHKHDRHKYDRYNVKRCFKT